MAEKLYIVERGNLFYGTAEQWKDVFFSNVSDEAVEQFCRDKGWSLHMIEEEPIDFISILTIDECEEAIAEQLKRATKVV